MQHKITEVFNEIQRSNMSKLGSDGKPIYREDGKVLKGPNYFKPNIASILEKD
jgi:predicted HAD superfamily Cof-like phosphohydrolase